MTHQVCFNSKTQTQTWTRTQTQTHSSVSLALLAFWAHLFKVCSIEDWPYFQPGLNKLGLSSLLNVYMELWS